MEQKLIDQLWKHTHLIDEENAKYAWKTFTDEKSKQLNVDSPHLLSSKLFFPDASSTLFMSFHHELANNNIHYHDFFELLYVCKGTPIGVINDQEIQLKEGNLCIMNPNAMHYFKKYSEETDLILNIVLPKELFQKSIFQILFNDPVLNTFFIRYRLENEKQTSYLYLQHLDKDLEHMIELMLKEYLDKKKYSQVIIQSLLTLIFSFILRSYNEKNSHGNPAMAEIVDYIYMHYQSAGMDSVAAHFNYHPKYLSSLIHKHTGQTFRDLIVNIKLQNAINYLLYTNDSIEQIADIIGYKNKSSFFSLFKKVYGMSPAGYRKHYS